QILNNLAEGLSISKERAAFLLFQSKVEQTRRAQTLSVDEWKALAKEWQKM
ncbi:MAG: 16S rRNA (adenine(1518)-N(6)/adenine(1519)-N(6))-dimethyltransferase, partial [Candidatus Wildermuthbacteria bacterium]|nr:16S rRNA (adenine(1518)-N(6)/adenine(1519)-N(6))-dimethyltransferase [Candidatus Wildermuthbacteria bacterium]